MDNTPVYIEANVVLSVVEPFRDIFIAQLGAVGFESFTETDEGFAAYILADQFREEDLNEALIWDGVKADYTLKTIEQVNWNAEWERNFDPIDVDGRVFIRAPFHEDRQGYEHNLLIEPKMSFGTGHHQTTHMMIQWLLEDRYDGLDVLDMGCGTGILGIVAGIRGAKSLHGIDIDQWCIDNTLENAERNNVEMTAVLGGADALSEQYDLILANINLNVLLGDMEHYASHLRDGGTILFSGFYEHDIASLRERAESFGLTFVGKKERQDWRSIKMIK
ncbi:MAG: hypothetical protein RL754_268 [Bacteroidota bacterium]|jgi:ribosomal protein L11 methyltransferase